MMSAISCIFETCAKILKKILLSIDVCQEGAAKCICDVAGFLCIPGRFYITLRYGADVLRNAPAGKPETKKPFSGVDDATDGKPGALTFRDKKICR